MTLDRRGLMTAAIAGTAGVMSMQGRSALADTAASASATGSYTYDFGDMTVTAATDGYVRRELQAGFVTNADFDAVKAALEAAFMPTDTLDIPFTPMVEK